MNPIIRRAQQRAKRNAGLCLEDGCQARHVDGYRCRPHRTAAKRAARRAARAWKRSQREKRA